MHHHEERDEVETLRVLPGMQAGLHGIGPGHARGRVGGQAHWWRDVRVLGEPEDDHMGYEHGQPEVVHERRAREDDEDDVARGDRKPHPQNEAREQQQDQRQE